MKLKPGFEEEYKKRHDKIWPELGEELTRAGVADSSIFLDEETNILVAVQKLAVNNTADQLPQTEIVKKWCKYMAEIMDINPDHSPKVIRLKEMFHQD